MTVSCVVLIPGNEKSASIISTQIDCLDASPPVKAADPGPPSEDIDRIVGAQTWIESAQNSCRRRWRAARRLDWPTPPARRCSLS